DLPVERQARARQRHRRPAGDLEVAALDVGVLDRQLRHHLADQVVEVGAVGDGGEPRLVALPDRLPVETVHVLDVEPVAIAAPHLVEDLGPLLGGDAVHHQAGGGDRLLRRGAGGRRVVEAECRAGADDDLGTVGGEAVAVHVVDERGRLPVLDREDLERGRLLAVTAVVEGGADEVEEVPLLRGEPAVVVSFHGHLDHTPAEAVEVDGEVGGGGGGRGGGFRSRCGGRG